jgi:hypothetical protein
MNLLSSVLGIVAAILVFVAAALVALWTAGALYFDVGRGRWFARPLSLLWLALVVAAFVFWYPLWQPFLVLLAAFAVFLVWWFSQEPSQDRQWNPNFAVLPSFEMDGDTVTAHKVRSTEYRTLKDFTPKHETRVYRLSNLRGVDGVITYWGSPWLCHPMLVFDFSAEGRLCISIEVRYRVGQRFGFWRSLYRQQEIMYVVSDERDAILRRSRYGKRNDVYLYRLQADPEEIRKVFQEYVVSTNRLVTEPRWYQGLTANCTTSIYRQRTRRIEWDWRWLFNGRIDAMMYDNGRMGRKLPFEQLKAESRVNDRANRAPIDGFGDFIRQGLPTYR